MLITSHSLIGAAMSRLIPNPCLGYPISLLLHFLADLLPHWDLRTRRSLRPKTVTVVFSLTDSLIGFFLGWLFFRQQVPLTYLLTMIFVSQLPDWLESPYLIFEWQFPPFTWIKKLQSCLHHKLDLPWGLVGQILIVAALVIYARAA